MLETIYYIMNIYRYLTDLPEEIIYKEISKYLSDNDYLNLIQTTKLLSSEIYKRDINTLIKMGKYEKIPENIKNKYNFRNILYDYNNWNPSILPLNITHLTFEHEFNQRVNELPENLTHLTFGWEFNQSVNELPKNITHLQGSFQLPSS